jgi:hypothetical protein
MTGTTGNLGPAAATTVASFTRDIVAPSITVISKAITDTTVTYSYTFSEPVVGLTASAITLNHSVSGGATGWDISTPVRVPNTNVYVFTVSNANAMAGNVTLSLSTTAVRDESGNGLTAANLVVSTIDQSLATLAFLQSYTVGTLNSFSLATPNVLAPQITLNGRGQTIAGFRITNKDFVSGDVFTLPAGSYGDITVASNANGVITLSGTTATISQWQTALRTLRLQLGNTGGSSREFEFHMQPTKNYWLDNGHFYEIFDNSATLTLNAANTLVSSRTLFGVAGYLAIPNNASENAFIAGLSGIPANSYIGLNKTASGASTVKIWATGAPNVGSASPYSNWAAGEPNTGSALGTSIFANGTWNDADLSAFAYYSTSIVEYGSTGVAVADLVKTASIAVDNQGPSLTLTRTAANQTGPSVQFRLTGNEGIDCTTVTSADFTVFSQAYITLIVLAVELLITAKKDLSIFIRLMTYGSAFIMALIVFIIGFGFYGLGTTHYEVLPPS